jgi:hypothetical protein
MGDEQNGHGMSRLDRMEGLMQLLIDDHLKFSDEHKSLLTSQILLTDRMGKLVGTVDTLTGETGTLAETIRQIAESQMELAESQKGLAESQKGLAESQKELSEAQKHTDERMNALIAIVDDLIRKRPN